MAGILTPNSAIVPQRPQDLYRIQDLCRIIVNGISGLRRQRGRNSKRGFNECGRSDYESEIVCRTWDNCDGVSRFDHSPSIFDHLVALILAKVSTLKLLLRTSKVLE